jgi:aerobic-type carbon monoxide dehydrogenase small subunit (CoxS/CutS family)
MNPAPDTDGALRRRVRVTVNGRPSDREVEVRKLLVDFVREDLGLTGTHIGCEHGICGACTVLVNGEPVRACLMLAVQTDGAELLTVEGLAPDERTLHPLQRAFAAQHALQCGFCTPGILLSMKAFLDETPAPTEEEVREALAGNLCRCTGYENIVTAVLAAAADRRPAGGAISAVAGPADTELPRGERRASDGSERRAPVHRP